MHPLILIAGPSASGKSTLSAEVATRLNLPCLSLDDFFIRGKKILVDTDTGPVRSFERPELYDGPKLALRLFNRTSGLVVEGFCLFCYPEIRALPSIRFYLNIPFDVCVQRRMERRPRRPSDNSFIRIGESENTSFVLPQQFVDGVHALDGMKPTTELAEQIVQIVNRVPTGLPDAPIR